MMNKDTTKKNEVMISTNIERTLLIRSLSSRQLVIPSLTIAYILSLPAYGPHDVDGVKLVTEKIQN